MSSIPQPSSEIIQGCKRGDNEAFKMIVEMYQQYTYNLAFKFLLHEEDARDIVQEVFLKLWKNMKKYNEKFLFTTWLYKIATNLCFDKIKSKKIRKVHSLYDVEDEIGNDNNIEDEISNKDLIKRIKYLSTKLTSKQRIIFVLRDLQDLSMEEISKILKMSKDLIKSNLYYARKNIKEKIFLTENTGGLKNVV